MGIGGGSAELRSARGGVPRLVVAILVAVAGLTILTMLAAALALLSFTRGHAYDPVPALSSLPKGEPGTPPARTNAALAYDDATRQLILFGGQSVNGDALDDTWNWDGSEWRRIQPAQVPGARHLAALVYDGQLRKVVLYGGFSGGGVSAHAYSDMWAWNGADWQPIYGISPVAFGFQRAIAYDDAHQELVAVFPRPLAFLQRRQTALGLDSATWVWRTGFPFGAWRDLGTGGPRLLSGQFTAYDARSARVIFLGYSFSSVSPATVLPGQPRLETWSWDGVRWTRLQPARSPTQAPWAMVEGPGGRATAITANGWLWEWDGDHRNWIIAPVFAGPINAAAAYDRSTRQIVAFGGLAFSANARGAVISSETWTWNGTQWSLRG